MNMHLLEVAMGGLKNFRTGGGGYQFGRVTFAEGVCTPLHAMAC